MASAIGAVLISTILPPLADLAMEKLKAMAVDKVNGIVNIVSDISNLQTTLGMIQDIVQVAEEKQINYDFIRNWLRDLVDIAYEARDVLDDFITFPCCVITAVEDKKPVNSISSFMLSCFCGLSRDMSKLPLPILNRLANDIRSVREKFDQKKNDGKTFTKLKAVVGGGSEIVRVDSRSEVGPCINRDALFLGRDEVKEEIMEKILHPNDNRVDVVAIWGMGGIGKTTLAQSIYNDKSVKKVPRRWLYVGESKFSAKKVISEMVVDQNTKAGIENLQTKLVEKLRGDRFLLVLDDVWEVDGREWDLLFNPLTEVGKGGLIIITTRKREVCTATKTQETYDLKPLSEEDSLSLFESCAYLNGKADSTPDLKRTRKKIFQKLSGLPLALEVVGRSLLNKDYSTWTDFLESNDNEVMLELRRSYNHLPRHLKICFTYCALFPKEHVFDNEKVLVEMWMAHDLIKKEQQKRPEDVGAQYFEELVNASLLQRVDGKYVMHNLIHDLALLVSNGEFATANGSLSIDQMETVRHITITNDDEYSKNLSLCKSKRIFTVYTPYKWKWHERSILEKDILHEVFKQSKSLRVLVLSYKHISEIPHCISELRHLRYLDVSRTSVKILPDSLCDLYNLQMLAAPLDAKLPRDLIKMVNLRHVRANLSTCTGVGKLISLQELSSIRVCEGDYIREFGDMQRIRGKFTIKGLENVEKLEDDVGALMEKQTLIDKLELVFDKENSENITISKKVLNALGCPPNLKCLDIIVNTSIQRRYKLRAKTWWKQNVCEGDNIREPGDVQRLRGKLRMMDKQTLMDKLELEFDKYLELELDVKEVKNFYEEVLDALGFPPNLTYLKIVGYNGLKPPSWMVDGKHKFDKLQSLELSDCPKLEFLPPLKFDKLQSLELSDCPKLEFLPPLGELTSLKCLNLWNVGVKRLGDEFYGKFTNSKVFFPSLESLVFKKMNEWEEWDDITIENSSVSFFPRLTTLEIQDCAKLVSVLPVVKNLIMNDANFMTSLCDLYIRKCDGLRSLPPDFHKFSSLYGLQILLCPQLQLLPADGFPPSLTHLIIKGCPLLYEHCKDESGPDWHKINRIPIKYISLLDDEIN